MSSGAQQLKEDFVQVQKLLETYPDIKITNTEGDPPEQYDIEYIIKGYRTNPDGAPTPDNNHEVRITLPFGYPHFPPTVKPITPIFHPDIDPDAIRIADFWQENHSLSDLIIHIGQMICGNHYTKDEPFNQNAFEWFEERSSWLPFDILEPRDEDDIEEIETDSSPSDTEVEQSSAPATDLDIPDLDILKDDIDFPFDDDDDDFGGLEDEISFDLKEDTVTEDLTEQEETESPDEVSFDLDDEKSAETFNFQEDENAETEDLFSLDAEDIEDNLSFDITDELDNLESTDESSLPDGLFDLEAESTDEESTLEFDSEDIASAFGEEVEASDTTLDDLAGLEEEDDALDFGLADESIDIGGGDTADLSGLEEDTPEENNEEFEFDTDESNEDEEKILSALSLNEEFASADKLEGKSQAILSLIEQKQIFSAKKILTELPDSDALPEKEKFDQAIADAISEAENLYKKADTHEQKGEFEKAGILLDLVANIATDFPGLDFARNRIRESMMADGKKKPDADHDDNSGEAKDEEADASEKTLPRRKNPVPS
jgi:ubiquitin-protein ligase